MTTDDRAERIRRILGKLEALLRVSDNVALAAMWSAAMDGKMGTLDDFEARLDRSLRDLGVREGEPAPCPGCGTMLKKLPEWLGVKGETLCPECGHRFPAPSATPREPGGGAACRNYGPTSATDSSCYVCGGWFHQHSPPPAVTGAGVGKGET